MQRSKGLEEPQRQLNEALDAKFGKDPQAKQRPPFKEQITSLKAAEVKSSAKKGDHLVVLKIKTTAVKDGKEETKEETMGAVKEGDAWKLLPPGRDGTVDENTLKQVTAQTVQFTAQIPKIKEAMEKITKEVKDGKYKSREEAQKALDEFLKGKK